jgi:NAD-dependent dihydropyrimidine dehydrogenase PreA subunit
MKKSQLFAILALWALLMPVNLVTKDPSKSFFGGLPWWAWIGLALLLVVTGVAFAVRDSRRARLLLEEPLPPKREEDDGRIKLTREQLQKYDPDGPSYPHPVVITERCIGCHACVDACPHDVLAIVNGISTPVAPDQCMEDTSCQVECPVNPKACIVVNTNKKIPPRKVPNRDAKFMTDVPGCFIIGDRRDGLRKVHPRGASQRRSRRIESQRRSRDHRHRPRRTLRRNHGAATRPLIRRHRAGQGARDD